MGCPPCLIPMDTAAAAAVAAAAELPPPPSLPLSYPRAAEVWVKTRDSIGSDPPTTHPPNHVPPLYSVTGHSR